MKTRIEQGSYSPCKRDSKHKIRCRIRWQRSPMQGRWNLKIVMKHKRDALGNASYPISVGFD
jgi:hypothetical protein